MSNNNKKAQKYLKKAAKKNNVDAIRNLGIMYEKGIGVEQDLKKAGKYFKQGANLCDFYSTLFMLNTTKIDDNISEERRKYLRIAASFLYSDAFYELGRYYYWKKDDWLKYCKQFMERSAELGKKEAESFCKEHFRD